ncbi:MAG: peptidylprolyl isomerase [Deltaproteobacteria bacterium]|nr:peptidylprolyl isomerase [Deltaproteobacteria bacterium]
MKLKIGSVQRFKIKGGVLFIALFAVVISVSLYGCAKKSVPSSKVIATVGEKPITVGEFKSEIAKLPPNLAAYLQTPAGSKKLLKSLVDRQLLVNEAIKEGINRSKAYNSQVSDFKKGLLVQLLLQNEVANKVLVTTADAKAYYKKHFLSFNLPLKINVSYIQSNSLKRAQTAYNLLKSGKQFAAVARKYSTAPNAKSGGILGWIKFEQTTPVFNNAAFSLHKIGEYSNIVRVGNNFDIIMLNNIIAGKPKPFSKVKNNIIIMMKQKESAKTLESFVKKLRAKSNVKYFYNNLPTFKSAPQKKVTLGSKKQG